MPVVDWQRDDRCPALVSRRRSGCLPGCLFGAYCYQAGLFDDRTMQVVEDAMRLWRKRLRGKLDEVCMAHPPREAASERAPESPTSSFFVPFHYGS